MKTRIPSHIASLLRCIVLLAICHAFSPLRAESSLAASAEAHGSVINLRVLGPTLKLTPTLAEPVKWTSSDPTIVIVVQGWVFGKKAGKAVVRAVGADESSASFSVEVGAGNALSPAPRGGGRIDGFVTRQGNQLIENGRPFRFISWNVPNLHIVEDPSWVQRSRDGGRGTPVFWHRVTTAEQEDAVTSVAQMGGNVIRAYTLSVVGGRNNRVGPSHYTGPSAPLNEELMQDYDRMIALCGQNGIRLILPVIDEWDWFGGRKEFAQLSGGGDFYTTRKVIDDFEALVRTLLNRVNTVTGVAYKDDPAIMAWETGNELQHVPAAWTAEIAALIKANAPRQLVADGANGSITAIDDPNIDLLTDHYYDHGGKDYIARVLKNLEKVRGKKPFFVGEFGCTDPDMELGAMDAVLHSGATGALFWSLRFHSAEGGFYWHNEGGQNSAYHWPGFSSNARSDEIRVLREMREKAWAIRGYSSPARERPAAPTLLPVTTPSAIVWMGSAGAEKYALERSLDGTRWTSVATDLSDAGDPFEPYADTAAPTGVTVHYRMKALNVAGESPWSPVLSVSPDTARGKIIPGNDPRIAVMGRTEWDGSALQLGFPGVTLRLRYRGPAPALRFFASTGDCYFNLSCNGWDPVVIRLKRGANAIVPPAGIAPEEGWVIELARRTESFQGTVGFEGVELPPGAELLSPPAWPERKLLFIGDSTTTGEYVDRFPPEYDATARSFNAPRSFAALLGRRLNAQTHLVAYGGQGLMRDWAGKATDVLLPLIYSRALPDKVGSSWNPRWYPADAVIVNVGTDADHGLPAGAELTEAYAAFVARIRADYPKAAIVLCQNSHQPENSPARAQLLRVLEEVQARQKQSDDQRVFVARCRFYPGTPNDPHLVAFQQEQLADELLPVLKRATGW